MKIKLAFLLLLFTLMIFTINFQTLEISSYDDIPLTPNDEFFNTAIDFFRIDPEGYRLTVTGAVTNNLSLTLDEIKAMPVTSEIVRMTCVDYKYGRTHMTGVANFTGVKLSYILNLAKISFIKAKDVSFHTPDPNGYSTSLNLEEAFWGDVILAYEMNEETMPV
ncbi:MAG: molybdopterin-dependent oxidoreductase, partial [Candidatus Hodarchaeota archaeon]